MRPVYILRLWYASVCLSLCAKWKVNESELDNYSMEQFWSYRSDGVLENECSAYTLPLPAGFDAHTHRAGHSSGLVSSLFHFDSCTYTDLHMYIPLVHCLYFL